MKNNIPLTEQRTLLLDWLTGNYWWCPNCQGIPSAATFEEKCDDCGCGLFTTKPVMIGDVLDKMEKIDITFLADEVTQTEDATDRYNLIVESEPIRIYELWQPLGYAKSLNEILDGATCWSNCKVNCPEPWCEYCEAEYKDDNVQDLHNFLWEMFKSEIINLKN